MMRNKLGTSPRGVTNPIDAGFVPSSRSRLGLRLGGLTPSVAWSEIEYTHARRGV